jgi:CRISPR/Cas system-associated exonuclease Cas4 (RecB family)
MTVNHWVAGSSPARGASSKMPIYNKDNTDPYKLSRTRIENFCRCKKCFYLEEKLGISRPASFPFNLNNAVDELLKEEFDSFRGTNKNHPYIEDNGLDAKPFDHPEIENWRTRNKGIGFLDEETNLYFYGLVDDVWINTKTDQLILVDYKATSKKGEVTLDAPWQISYKRQIEIYQWLFRKNGFDVQNIGYFVYCNGIKENVLFNNELKFKVKIIHHKGDDSWLDKTVKEIYQVLNSEEIPEPSPNCEYCRYVKKANL